MRWFVILVLSGAVAAGAESKESQRAAAGRTLHFPFPFVDEANQEPSFAEFRKELLQVIHRRDGQALVKSLAPELRAREQDSLATVFSTAIPYETERALLLGGSFTTSRGAVHGRREFCAPYVYSAFPNEVPHAIESTEDPWAIIGPHVPVRVKPLPTARVLTYLSWELVKADGWLDPDAQSHRQWAELDLLDGRTGYVQEGQIRHGTDYHVCFAKIDGRWLMTAFARDVYPARGH